MCLAGSYQLPVCCLHAGYDKFEVTGKVQGVQERSMKSGVFWSSGELQSRGTERAESQRDSVRQAKPKLELRSRARAGVEQSSDK